MLGFDKILIICLLIKEVYWCTRGYVVYIYRVDDSETKIQIKNKIFK